MIFFFLTGNELERALRSINREDVVQKCMYNVETIQDEVELAAAKVAMDQSGRKVKVSWGLFIGY
jgi:ankyrin